MIYDAEELLFTELVKRLKEKYTWASNGKVGFSNDWVKQPEKLPWVTFCEEDNRTEIRYHDTANEENAVRLTYQVDVWTNREAQRKKDGRKIVKAIDDELLAMGFRRTYLNNDPSLSDGTLYRYIGRYSTVAEQRDDQLILYHRR